MEDGTPSIPSSKCDFESSLTTTVNQLDHERLTDVLIPLVTHGVHLDTLLPATQDVQANDDKNAMALTLPSVQATKLCAQCTTHTFRAGLLYCCLGIYCQVDAIEMGSYCRLETRITCYCNTHEAHNPSNFQSKGGLNNRVMMTESQPPTASYECSSPLGILRWLLAFRL